MGCVGHAQLVRWLVSVLGQVEKGYVASTERVVGVVGEVSVYRVHVHEPGDKLGGECYDTRLISDYKVG